MAIFPLHVYLYACFFSSYYKDPSYVGLMGLPGSSVVKNPPANAGEVGGGGVQSLGWEDPLEKEMATHSSILAWEIPWTEEPGGPQSMGSQELTMTEKQQVLD